MRSFNTESGQGHGMPPWFPRRWHWALLVLGLLLRLACGVYVLRNDPFGGWDGKEYYAYAGNLMHGLGDQYEPRIMNFVRAPFFAIFLIPFRALSDALWPIVAAQAFLGCFLCLVLARTASNWAGRRAGDICFLLSVFNPFLIYPCGFVLSECLFMTLAWLGMACLLRLANPAEKDPLRWVTWAGVWWALAGLTRGALLGFLPAAALWLGAVTWSRVGFRSAFVRMALMTATSSAILLPWMIGSYITAGEFTIAPRQAAMIAAISNSPEFLKSYRAQTKEEYYSLQMAAIDRMAKPPAHLQLEHWKSELRKFRDGQRPLWLRLQAYKAVHFWTPWLNPLYTPGSQVLLSVLWNVPIFLVGLWGFIRGPRDSFSWLLILLCLVTFLVHFWLQVAVRYRYPTVDIALMLFTSRVASQLGARGSLRSASMTPA